MTASSTRQRAAPRILCPELVGRQAESAALDALLAEAARGVMKTALVAGDAGVGKTALTRRFVARARAAGALVLAGDCVQAEPRRPFGPFVDLLRSAEKELSVVAVEQLLRRNAVELFRLLPERWGSSAVGGGDRGARERVHESFVAFLGSLAHKRPLVIIIEDLHWADEASLQLFPLLVRRLGSRSVLLLATYRSDELHRLHPLRPVVAELVRARIAETLPVNPLTSEGAAEVVRTALRWAAPPPVGLREAIDSRCEGNPFFIEEVLQALADRGGLIHDGETWRLGADMPVAIPTTVRAAVQDRIGLLEEDSRRVLEVAAVIGQRFDHVLLAKVTRAAEIDITRALRASIEAQLVVEGEGEDTYEFRHALTRESVLADMLQRELRTLHLAIGEAIESIAGAHLAERAEELAYHFDEAHDESRALRYRDLAAQAAVAVAAYSRASYHLERAVMLAPAGCALLAELQLRLAETATRASDFARAERGAIAARELFMDLQDRRGAGRATLLLGRHRREIGDTAAGYILESEGVAMLEPLGDSEALALAYADIAWHAVAHPGTGDAEWLAGRAVDMARRTRSPAAVSWALQSLGAARMTAGRFDDALDPHREGLKLALDNNIADLAQRGYSNLFATLRTLGAPRAERQRILSERDAHARRFGVRTPLFLNTAAWFALGRGDWDEALSLAAELAASDSHLKSSARLCATFIELARGGPARVWPAADELLQQISQSADPMVARDGQNVVLLHAFVGDNRSALAAAERLAVEQSETLLDRSAVILYALFAAGSSGENAATDRWIERSRARVWHARSPIAVACQHVAKAENELRAGAPDNAIDALGKATEALTEEEMPFIEALIRLRRADLLMERGAAADRDAAASELAAIVPFWRRTQSKWFLARLRNWAKERRVPLPRDGRRAPPEAASGHPLTQREHQVAVLVSQGLTNREIAAQLGITERTAEGHIEQIRNKLGVRSRSLIAVWASTGRR